MFGLRSQFHSPCQSRSLSRIVLEQRQRRKCVRPNFSWQMSFVR